MTLMSLTDREQALIEAATMQPWTPQLREMLALAVKYRGGDVKRYDSCGDLVETLELLARTTPQSHRSGAKREQAS